MKTKVIIGIVVVLVIGGFFLIKKPSNDSTSQNKVQKVVKDTLSKLDINSGVHCVMDKDADVEEFDNVKEMEFYLHGEKFRYNGVTQNSNGQEVGMHVINDGNYSYMWGEGVSPMGAGNGIKVKNDYNSENGPIDIDEFRKSNFTVPGYECNSWLPKESNFTPPENINFKDFSFSSEAVFQ